MAISSCMFIHSYFARSLEVGPQLLRFTRPPATQKLGGRCMASIQASMHHECAAQHLVLPGKTLAYCRVKPRQQGPSIVLCNGLKSSMIGLKSEALHNLAVEQGLGYVRFDYRGHGASSGDFLDLGPEDWLADVLDVLHHVVEPGSDVLLVGSSIGGWLALHAALHLQAKQGPAASAPHPSGAHAGREHLGPSSHPSPASVRPAAAAPPGLRGTDPPGSSSCHRGSGSTSQHTASAYSTDTGVKIRGVVCIAPAVDMAAQRWAHLPPDVRVRLAQQGGSVSLQSPYAAVLQGGDHVGVQYFAQGLNMCLLGGLGFGASSTGSSTDASTSSTPEIQITGASRLYASGAEGQTTLLSSTAVTVPDAVHRRAVGDTGAGSSCDLGGPPLQQQQQAGGALLAGSAAAPQLQYVLHPQAALRLPCPVHVMHGAADEVVPLHVGRALAAALVQGGTPGVVLHEVPAGDHRLSTPQDLDLLKDWVLKLAGRPW